MKDLISWDNNSSPFDGLVQNPGDTIQGTYTQAGQTPIDFMSTMTDSGRKVDKLDFNNGQKTARTTYPNGTTVTTVSTK